MIVEKEGHDIDMIRLEEHDKVGGVVGGDRSWELLWRDKLLKGGDGWVGDNDMERELFEFWVLELDESKSEGGVGINKSSSESLSYS